MDDNKKKQIGLAQFILSLGTAMFVSAGMSQLDSCIQLWFCLILGVILMAVSAYVYSK